MDDTTTPIILGIALLIMAPLGAWTAVRHELAPSDGRRAARYGANALALICGFGVGQFGAIFAAPQMGFEGSNMLFTLAGAFVGCFVAMALVQAFEFVVRRMNGLPPMPYQLIRFDLLRF